LRAGFGIELTPELVQDEYEISDYRAHLGRLLGLFEPLERAAARAAYPAEELEVLNRARALGEDLLVMGTSAKEIEALERCRELPWIAPAGLRGYTYVMLGSMLGGRIIVQRLRTSLGPDASFRFYGEGNERSEALWKAFCLDLEENGKEDVQAICATAVGIFDAYAEWLAEPPLRFGIG